MNERRQTNTPPLQKCKKTNATKQRCHAQYCKILQVFGPLMSLLEKELNISPLHGWNGHEWPMFCRQSCGPLIANLCTHRALAEH